MKVSWHLTTLLLCGSALIGCGSGGDSVATDQPASDGAPATSQPVSAASPTDTAAPAAEKVDVDPILVGLLDDFEDLPQDFAEIKTAYEKDPEDAEAIRNYVGTVEDLGIMHAQRGNTDRADAAFIRASVILSKAFDKNVELNAGQLSAVVFYNHACVLGKTDQAVESLSLLNKSIDNGFSNVAQLQSDSDLESVRALPQFASELSKWEAHFDELRKQREAELVAKAKEDLKNGKSFDFDFDLTDINGKPVSLDSEAFKGRVRIVDIWGTWCPPCRQEVPSFVKLQDKYHKYGLQVVGLNQERGPSENANVQTVQEFTANNSVNYPCALVTDEVLEQLPELKGYPTTLFIDHTGKVRMTSVGYHDYAYMEAVVKSLLTELHAEQRANTN